MPEFQRIREIKDRDERLKALDEQRVKAVGDSGRLDKYVRQNPLKIARDELDDYFGVKLGIGTGGPSGKELVTANRSLDIRRGTIKRLEDEARGLKPLEQKQNENPERRQVTLAQAGFGAPGSTYEDLQVELLKQGTEEPKDPIRGVLEAILEQLKKNNGEAGNKEKPAPPMFR